MSEARHLMQNTALDVGKGALPGGFLLAFFSGWTIADWAAFAALVYTLCLLAEKAWQWGRLAWRRFQARPA